MSKDNALKWVRLNIMFWPMHIIGRERHVHSSPEGWKWKYVHQVNPSRSEMVLYSLCSDETIVHDEVIL